MLLSGVCLLSAKGSATIRMQLDSLKRHYGVSFVYDPSAVGEQLENQVPSDFVISGGLKADLESLLRNVPVAFQIRGRYVILKKKAARNSGLRSESLSVKLAEDKRQDVILEEQGILLKEAVVSSESRQDALREPAMGKESINAELVKSVPAFGGESDIIKTIQLLPGIQSPSEGSTSYCVRGGGLDQNLILLDEAPIYCAGHLVGFFSVFNNDAIRDANIYKGDMDARFGGRLSSTLDIRMKEGRADRFGGNVEIGLIASKAMIEGPIGKKASYLFSARRTYIDAFFPLITKAGATSFLQDGTSLYFYDLNGKVNVNVNDNNRLYLSVYSGRDRLGGEPIIIGADHVSYGNKAMSLRWNHIFTPNLLSNVTAFHTKYDIKGVNVSGTKDYYADVRSTVSSDGLKMDNTWYANSLNTMTFGIHIINHRLNPLELIIDRQQDYTSQKTHSFELDAYIQNIQRIGTITTLRYGLRFSNYLTFGDSESQSGRISSYHKGLEPRVSVSVMLSPTMSIKASYSRNIQYLQQVANSVAGSPFDIWFSASKDIKPQISNQVSLGVFKDFLGSRLMTSLEMFCKRNRNTVDFKNNTTTLFNEYYYQSMCFGKSFAYGAEAEVKYSFGNLDGWLSYTYTKAKYDIPELNGGRLYDAPRIRGHDFSIVANYRFGKRLSGSLNWVYCSGIPTSYPTSWFPSKNTNIPFYSERNADRLPDYHRLDLSVLLEGKNHGKRRVYGDWLFSIYNVYARKNVWAVYFENDKEHQTMKSKMLYPFSIVPSVSFKLTF